LLCFWGISRLTHGNSQKAQAKITGSSRLNQSKAWDAPRDLPERAP
jgi:hypothetical protein